MENHMLFLTSLTITYAKQRIIGILYVLEDLKKIKLGTQQKQSILDNY